MDATTAFADCYQCRRLAVSDQLPARCGECGYLVPCRPVAVVASWRPSRGVEGFLRDLTALRLARLAVPGARSGMGTILDGLRDGIVGHGNRGTKGAGAPDVSEPRPLPSRHPAEPLYASLRGTAREVATLFVEGLVTHSAGEAAKLDGVSLTVEQAVGLHRLTPDERKVVRLKIATKDRRPALTRMEYLGVAALDAAARAWV